MTHFLERAKHVSPSVVLFPLAVAVVAVVLSGCNSSQADTPPSARAVPVRVETIHMTSIEDASHYAAVIRPRVETDMGFRVGGKMVRRLVEVGSRVTPGTPLAQLDSTDLELQASGVDANLASARAEARTAEADFQRYAELKRGQWTTQQEFDRRKAAMETATARMHAVETQQRVAHNSAQYATLVADTDGVVTAILAEAGQVVGQGQAVLRIAKLGEVEAVVSIPEQKVQTFSQSHLAIELWSMPGVALQGRLREIAPTADAETRTYQARVTLIDPPADVQLGMTATVKAVRTHDGETALLPMTALTKDGDRPAVWTLNDRGDGLRLRPIQVASYVGDQAVVSGGLDDGDRVVTAGVQKLDAGQRVRVWTEPQR